MFMISDSAEVTAAAEDDEDVDDAEPLGSGKKCELVVEVLQEVWRVRLDVQPLLVELPRCRGMAGGDIMRFLEEFLEVERLILDGDEGMAKAGEERAAAERRLALLGCCPCW
jgi:hypothetical protein